MLSCFSADWGFCGRWWCHHHFKSHLLALCPKQMWRGKNQKKNFFKKNHPIICTFSCAWFPIAFIKISLKSMFPVKLGYLSFIWFIPIYRAVDFTDMFCMETVILSCGSNILILWLFSLASSVLVEKPTNSTAMYFLNYRHGPNLDSCFSCYG